MNKMLSGVIVLMAIVLVLGVSWGKLFKRGYTQDECGVELAMVTLGTGTLSRI